MCIRDRVGPGGPGLLQQFRLERARLGIVASVDDRTVRLASTLTDIVQSIDKQHTKLVL